MSTERKRFLLSPHAVTLVHLAGKLPLSVGTTSWMQSIYFRTLSDSYPVVLRFFIKEDVTIREKNILPSSGSSEC